MNKTRSSMSVRTLVTLVTALTLSNAWAAKAAPQPPANAAAEAVYQKERAACLRGASSQGRATCLTEAGAALAEARRSRLDSGENARDLYRNAELRCKDVVAADRDSCRRMAHGEGVVSGSVDGGGVLKELVTVTVEPVAAIPPAPAASR